MASSKSDSSDLSSAADLDNVTDMVQVARISRNVIAMKRMAEALIAQCDAVLADIHAGMVPAPARAAQTPSPEEKRVRRTFGDNEST